MPDDLPAPITEATVEADSPPIEKPDPQRERLPLRPLKTIHAFWIAGMSCDGCSVAVTGATNPGIEPLLAGTMPAMPQLILHHPVLAVEAGDAFVANYEKAAQGELDAPYVVIMEGSVADESLIAEGQGYWSGMGVRPGPDGSPQPIPTAEWLERMAPGAAAVIAIGTCATWGGIPAAAGNPTGAMGVMDFLGADFRSAFGLPVINIPGCAPIGDNFTETVAAVLLFLQGIGPLPEFDELGRPAWMFTDTVHEGCTRGGFYEEGKFAERYGDKECLVEIGCWGPVVECNIVKRGAINHMGGCMQVGAPCIGCTMPGFPDAFSPFYSRPPGASVSSALSKTTGSLVTRLRAMSKRSHNMTTRWREQGYVPSGWGSVRALGPLERMNSYFYEKLQFWKGRRPGHHGRPAKGWGFSHRGPRDAV